MRIGFACFLLKQSLQLPHLSSGRRLYHSSKFSNFRSDLIRKYSQQQPEQTAPPLVIAKKVRTRKKKSFEKGISVEKTGFWNVVAVATAEEYELEDLHESLKRNENYQPTQLLKDSSVIDEGQHFIHAVAKSKIDNENREIFIFREGSLVAWNVSDAEMRNILNFIRDFEINRYDQRIVTEETEVMPYTYSINSKMTLLQNGNIYLSQEETRHPLHKYTYSNGMALSVKLGIWEGLLDKYIESMESVTIDLKLGNRIRMNKKELLRKTGELFALKHSINLSSNLLDIPDFYWEREELEKLFLRTCNYFDIPKRTKVINDKLNHCVELVDLLTSHLNDQHHIRLEWMIIVLIMVEVLFEIVHYAERFLG